MVRCSKFIPTLVVAMTCLVLYLTLQTHEQDNNRRGINHVKLPAHKCAIVRSLILQKPIKRMKERYFGSYINDLQKCPWEYNATEHHLLSSQLSKCCNAAKTLIVTQNNAPLGSMMKYETSQTNQLLVTEKIYKMFPEKSPFEEKKFETCAVVGNGGILLNSSCGEEIDKTDYVFRFNLPPLNIKDTGAKTNIVSANPSIVQKKFEYLYERRKSFIELVKTYGPAMILLPAFSYVPNTNISFRVFYTIEDFDMENKVVFYHPDYLRDLSIYWKTMGLVAKRMSTGLMLVSSAIELCKKVTLYGFWPFLSDPEGNQILHHYYDNVLPKRGFHAMPEEFYFYAKMHLKGVLHLKVGKC